MSPAQANNLLFPCTDFRRELSMEYCFEDPTPIKVHPRCVFFATANLGSQYTGTHKLDRALLDRFMILHIDPLSRAQITEVVKYHNPLISKEDTKKIVDVFFAILEAHNKYDISFKLSMRHLNDVCSLVADGFTIYDSFYAICRGLGGDDTGEFLKKIV